MSGEAGNSHTRLEIGRTLEVAREKRGLSLRQVEEATKIRSRYLRDLENENFDVLPAVYVIGSLKTYAHYLGLNGAVLAAELKRRQAALGAEQERTREEEPRMGKQHGLLASLSRFVGIGETAEDEAGTVPGPVNGHFVSLAVVLIFFLLATALVSDREGGGRVILQMRKPKMSQVPTSVALVGNVKGSGPASGYGKLVDKPEEQANVSSGDARNDDRAKAQSSERQSDAPRTAQVLAPPATAIASASASASAGASAGTPASESAKASPASSGSASAAATPAASAPTSAGVGSEPAAIKEPGIIRRGTAAVDPTARAQPPRPSTQRSGSRLRYPAWRQDLEQSKKSHGLRVVTLQKSSRASFTREHRP
jgi:transcriptional regulator with XRE-family HTH domain